VAGLTMCVALCTYNGEGHLAEQLDSLLGQTRMPDRMVAVDDGSEDGTAEVLRHFADRAPFPVEVHVNTRNLGYLGNFERAIRCAEGEVIALCDQDDVWQPDKLATMEAVFDRSPRTALVFTDAEVVDAELRPLGHGLWEAIHFTPARQAGFGKGDGFGVLLQGNVVSGAAMAFRSRFRDLVLPFPDGVVHDAWIALLISAVAPVEALPRRLLRYRQHGGNQIGVRKRGLAERISWARQVRARQFAELLRQHEQALQRLRSRAEVPPQRLQQLELAMRHLAFRCLLPDQRLRRLRPVLRELASGGYNRMANGLSSAVRDLVV
jgi:glycosyltransferase involved in cell wall biosynthesis